MRWTRQDWNAVANGDGVVRETDNDHLALRTLLAPDVHPEIENVVQVDVCEER